MLPKGMHSSLLLAILVIINIHDFFSFALENRRFPDHGKGHFIGIAADRKNQTPTSADCYLEWIAQPVDHFSFEAEGGTFLQRYFVCDRYWQPQRPDGSPGPIFFYVGNEADVTLYVNATGLMWENAADFGALIVFAEHRYYGQSVPTAAAGGGGGGSNGHAAPADSLRYLSSEQALADYARLIAVLQDHRSINGLSPAVVGFGGSYGGMLATWLRVKYPHLVAGAVAGSAPIWHFLGDSPGPDLGAFYRIVSQDASPDHGASPDCQDGVRAVWGVLSEMGKSEKGRQALKQDLGLCQPLEGPEDTQALSGWMVGAWSSLAMGNYPYPSSYLLNGAGTLPAWPVRVACSHFDGVNVQDNKALLSAMRKAVGVYYNSSGEAPCFDFQGSANNATAEVNNHWDYQYCTEMFMPMSMDGVQDMFWAQPVDLQAEAEACHQRWGLHPRTHWAAIEYGGHRILSSASNIVFSNGDLDPWAGTGVLESLSPSLVFVEVKDGAHHLDLMFSHPLDPQSVQDARKLEMEMCRQWIDSWYSAVVNS